MKKARNLIIWIIISIFVQTGILYYMNNYMFKNISKVSYKIIKTNDNKKKVVSVSIPGDADNIQISYTGKYASYTSNSSLHVIKMSSGEDKTVPLDCSFDNAYSKWRNSEDRLLIIEKGSSGIKVYKYDPSNGDKQQALDYNNKARTYELTRSSSNITGLETNDLNTIMYLKETNGKQLSYIDRLDISGELQKFQMGLKRIGDYYVFKAEDKVIFEDLAANKISVATSGSCNDINIPGVSNPKLIDVDNEGNLYVGNVVNDKVNEIYTASLNKKSSGSEDSTFTLNWDKTALKQPVDSKDIYVSDLGEIYTVNRLKGKVSNIKTGKAISFNNMYITMYGDSENGGIISRDLENNKLIETLIK
ncbi:MULTISPECIES: hypothetical protein [Clostridium]|uniref:hypothetical protein n=1 Tax=Clostridium TaxID=1485 RepID=UPI0008259300|nr:MULTISPECIES: hypothetical protein [Clostridium]PJI09489.1 hypothetical protein CUB90_17170 [Clostridium sp. CT7]